MSTYSRIKLSDSTSGKGIKVVATATPGTLLHTAVAGGSDIDEIWLYAFNSSASPITLTVEYGSASAPDDNIVCSVPAQSGLCLVVPGLMLNGGLTVKAFASSANVVVMHGFVNRITA
jgi:hypothetical protein